MLIFGRKPLYDAGENLATKHKLKPESSFQVGEATIVILRSNNNKVTIGVEAPQHVRICRDDAKDKG